MLPALQALPRADVLAFGAHPDDLEIGCAGTLLRLGQLGRSCVLVDASAGEKGSQGDAASRAAEATAAAARLGARARGNLGLCDTAMRDDDDSADRLVAVLRAVQPQLLLVPFGEDRHPDHVAAAAIAHRATFLAGLRNHRPELGARHRPRLVLAYTGNHPFEPSLVVDISTVVDAKAEVLRCFRSQIAPPAPAGQPPTVDVLDRAQVRDRYHGARIGSIAGEAYWHAGPLPVRDLAALLG